MKKLAKIEVNLDKAIANLENGNCTWQDSSVILAKMEIDLMNIKPQVAKDKLQILIKKMKKSYLLIIDGMVKPWRKRYEGGEKEAALELYLTAPHLLKLSPWLREAMIEIAMNGNCLEIVKSTEKKLPKLRKQKKNAMRDVMIYLIIKLMRLTGGFRFLQTRPKSYCHVDHKVKYEITKDSGAFEVLGEKLNLSPIRIHNIYYSCEKLFREDPQLQEWWGVLEELIKLKKGTEPN